MTSYGSQNSSGAPRYTIEFEVPSGGSTRVRAITPAGETMAVALATARLLMVNPDARFSLVTVVEMETEYTSDLEQDAIDYWNTA